MKTFQIIILSLIIFLSIKIIKKYIENYRTIFPKPEHTELENYNSFYKELGQDMNKYGIDSIDKDKLQIIVRQMVEDKKENGPKYIEDYVKSSETGLIKGCVSGFILGGENALYGGLFSGITYAFLNPIFMYCNL